MRSTDRRSHPIVGHIDTGIDPSTPGLVVRSCHEIGSGSLADGHGAFTAGVISRIAPDVEIHSVGLGSRATAWIDLVRALAWFVEHPVPVIAVGVGYASDLPFFDAVLAKVRQSGTLVVAPTGNVGPGRELAPVAAGEVLAVGVAHDGAPAHYSGGHVGRAESHPTLWIDDREALGWDVATRSWTTRLGTSTAAAVVAGEAALVVADQPGLSPQHVAQRVATKVGSRSLSAPKGPSTALRTPRKRHQRYLDPRLIALARGAAGRCQIAIGDGPSLHGHRVALAEHDVDPTPLLHTNLSLSSVTVATAIALAYDERVGPVGLVSEVPEAG